MEPDSCLKHGGSLDGIADKVEQGYFDWISINSVSWGIYLTPVYKSISSYHKYWPEDHPQVDQELGGIEGLRRLADILSNRNGRLMVDLVFNHSALTHLFFVDVLRYGEKSKYLNYYRHLPDLKKEKIIIPILFRNRDIKEQYRVLRDTTLVINERFHFPDLAEHIKVTEKSIEGKYFSFVQEGVKKANYGCWWNLPELPELNTLDKEVKKYLFNSASIYLELGIRHFRIDIPDALPNGIHFWREFREFLEQKTKDDALGLFMVGEIWDREKVEWFTEDGGKTAPFDAIINYSLRRAIIKFCRKDDPDKWNANDIRRYLDESSGNIELETFLNQLNMLGNHDVTRIGSMVKNIQDRKTAFALLFTFPGTPCLYYGDELGMKGVADGLLDNVRRTIKWGSGAKAVSEDHDLTVFLTLLLRIRKEHRELRDGSFAWYYEHEEILAFKRCFHGHECLVISASSRISDLLFMEWVNNYIKTNNYIVLGLDRNINLADITLHELQRARETTGAVIAYRKKSLRYS